MAMTFPKKGGEGQERAAQPSLREQLGAVSGDPGGGRSCPPRGIISGNRDSCCSPSRKQRAFLGFRFITIQNVILCISNKR